MERYLIFAGFDYYPKGGMKDYFRSASSIDEAREVIKITLTENVLASNCGFDIPTPANWAHAYDTQTMEIVLDSTEFNGVSSYNDFKLEVGEFGSFHGGIRSD